MQESTKLFLINQYKRTCIPAKNSCLKYYYQFHNVHVNVYFDAFEEKSVSLSMILSANGKYYYTPLNILNTGTSTQYLKKLPRQILEKILVDEHLTCFFENMESHLLKNKPRCTNYDKDVGFVNTVKNIKPFETINLPFWRGLRKVHMQDETMYKLSTRADISLETLKKIQQEGYTLVRTRDPNQRKELTLILQEIGITLL